MEKYQKEIVSALLTLGQKHDIAQVFADYVELMALALANQWDKAQFDVREQRYLEVVKRYTVAERNAFAEIMGMLVLEAMQAQKNGHLVDVLGVIYHELNLHSKWKAQFFTPQGIADMMGAITISKPPEGKLSTFLEPATGSGVMILGAANAYIDNNMDYAAHMKVCCIDTDLKCVHMCYTQLHLYGIAAHVIHGNSLTNEIWSSWFTGPFVHRGYVPFDPFNMR